MGLARWEPLSELRRMREDMDRFFESFWQAPIPAIWGMKGMTPLLDVFEKDENIMVKAELPGLRKEEVEITASDDSISLKGEFRHEEDVKEEGFVRRERRFGSFYRTIPMPTAIKPDQVKANFKDGVLTITAPKAAEAKAKEKKVTIEP